LSTEGEMRRSVVEARNTAGGKFVTKALTFTINVRRNHLKEKQPDRLVVPKSLSGNSTTDKRDVNLPIGWT